MSEEYSREYIMECQDRLDLYFKHKAIKLLPDCETFRDNQFQGCRIQFAKREVTDKRSNFIQFHADPVAAVLTSVVVKFKRIKPDDDEKAAGMKPRWELKVVVYGDKDNFPKAIEVLENPPVPKIKTVDPDKVVNKGGRPRKEPIEDQTEETPEAI